MKNLKVAAFSLTELLIALAIVGILVLIAMPNLMPLVTEAKSTEAKLQLKHLNLLEDRFFKVNSRYSNDFSELGFEQMPLVTQGGTANYVIEIVEANESSYTATATSVVDFDKDGSFNEWTVSDAATIKETAKD